MFKGNWDANCFNASERYNIYVMGPVPFYMTEDEKANHVGNYWTSFSQWPDTTPQHWYLSADGTATLESPTDGDVTYDYDPSNPCPATGANTLYSSTPCGPHEQSQILSRDDVVNWNALQAFTEPVAMVGKITAHLTV